MTEHEYKQEKIEKSYEELDINKLEFAEDFQKNISVITQNEEYGAFKESIKNHGIFEPIIVTETKKKGKYKILAGNMRTYAARELILKTVPAIIWKGEISDTKVQLVALIENALRRNITPQEKARRIAKVYESIGYTPEQALMLIDRMYHKTEIVKGAKKRGRERFHLEESKEFDQIFPTLGYSLSAQRYHLQLISNLEPEILDYAEQKALTLEQTRAVANRQLKDRTEGKAGASHLKKVLISQITKQPREYAAHLVNKTIEDIDKGVIDINKSNIVEIRDELKNNSESPSWKEGAAGAFTVWYNLKSNAKKIRMVLTGGWDSDFAYEENSEPQIRKDLQSNTNRYLLEMAKLFDDQQLATLLKEYRYTAVISEMIIKTLEQEEEDRTKKEALVRR